MIKLIVSDLDGTLFDSSHKLNKFSADAIHKAQEAGISFMVATGRAKVNVLQYFEEFQIQCPKILLNGAVFLNEFDEVEQTVPMQHEDVIQVMNLLAEHTMVGHLYCADGSACTNLEKMKTEFRKRLKTRENLSDAEIDQVILKSEFLKYDLPFTNIEEFLQEHPQVYKLEAFANDEEHIHIVRKKLYAMKHLDISNSVADNIEITDGEAQKGIMLKRVCEHMHITLDEVVTIGDSLNDLSLLRDFPNSYAVANACEEIKKVAAHIADSNLDNGVANLIHQILEKQGR